MLPQVAGTLTPDTFADMFLTEPRYEQAIVEVCQVRDNLFSLLLGKRDHERFAKAR